MTKAGARIEILLNATTRRDEHGKIIGVVGIGQDITARLAQEREYSKLIDSANAPILVSTIRAESTSGTNVPCASSGILPKKW